MLSPIPRTGGRAHPLAPSSLAALAALAVLSACGAADVSLAPPPAPREPCGASVSPPEGFTELALDSKLEGRRYSGPDGAQLIFTCIPKWRSGPSRLEDHAQEVVDELVMGIPADQVEVAPAGSAEEIDGHRVYAFEMSVLSPEAPTRSALVFTERAQMYYWIRYTAPVAQWPAQAEKVQSVFRSFKVLDPSADQGPTRWWKKRVMADQRRFTEARAAFKTRVRDGRPSTFSGQPAPKPPADLFTLVTVQGPVGGLATYVTPDPGDGKRHPAVVWAHGGHGEIGGSAWAPASRSSDSSGRALREVGLVMAVGSWRAENDNPGDFELFYGEVDDLLAVRDYVATLPYVDPDRIYLAGYGAGGTLVLLAAAKDDRFRAAFSIGGDPWIDDFEDYGYLGGIPFGSKGEGKNETEAFYRSAAPFVGSIRRPTWYIEGKARPAGLAQWMEDQARPSGVPFTALIALQATHKDIAAPATELIAQKILADTGPEVAITLTQAEIDALVVGDAPSAKTAAVH
jgi:acetyl esterase/lipase